MWRYSQSTAIRNHKSECFISDWSGFPYRMSGCFNRLEWIYPSRDGIYQIHSSASSENIHSAIQNRENLALKSKKITLILKMTWLSFYFLRVKSHQEKFKKHEKNIPDLLSTSAQFSENYRIFPLTVKG